MGTSSRSYISGIDPAKRGSLPVGVVPLMTTVSRLIRRFAAIGMGGARKTVRRSQVFVEAYGRVGVQRRPNLPDVHRPQQGPLSPTAIGRFLAPGTGGDSA